MLGRKITPVIIGMIGLSSSVISPNSLINNAKAGQTTTTMTISATVASNCNFTGSSAALAFGNYDPISAHATNDLTSTTTFGIRCTKGTTAALGMNNGNNASGTQRRMNDGNNNYLDYQLYTNNAYSTIWDSTNTVSYIANNSSPATINVYGKVPGGQDVPTGSYQDTVTITATY